MNNDFLPVPPALQYFTRLSDEQRARLTGSERQRMILEIKTHIVNAGGPSSVNAFQMHCATMLEALVDKPKKAKSVYI